MTRAELIERIAEKLYRLEYQTPGHPMWTALPELQRDFWRAKANAVVALIADGAEARVGDVFLRRMPPAHVARNVRDAVNVVLGEP